MDNYKLKYKEKTPEETVEFIKSFFAELDIETKEEWVEENEIGTYSLRLSLVGAPGIGSNGKGMTEAYARASAYAEFMERLQNMRMTSSMPIFRIQERNGGFFFHPSEKLITVDELVDENNSFIRVFFEKRGLKSATRENKIKELLNVQNIDYGLTKEYGKFVCVPFYSVRENKVCNIPYFLSSIYYASNGMCAGNTMDEALVQGISEIYERNANTRVLKEYISLPEIPEEYIARYEDVYRMYKILKGSTTLKMLIKDASFGGQFPVVALVLIEKNTGWCGVKFGAHPNIGIALERVFTEAAQGISLREVSHKSDLSFLNENVSSEDNLMNSFRTSNAQYPYQMIFEPSKYMFYEFENVDHLSNRDMLEAEIHKTLAQGYDVLIGDFSYSGFGSYQVIVPGLSEIGEQDDDVIHYALEKYHLQYLIGHPDIMNPELCKRLLNSLMVAADRVLENSIYFYSGVYSTYPYPGKEDYLDIYYLVIMCALSIGDYKIASSWARNFVNSGPMNTSKNKTDYIFVKKYADGMLTLGEHNKVICYLQNMFDEELCRKYDELFKDKQDIIKKIYPEIWCDSEYTYEFRKYEEMILKFKEYAEKHRVDVMKSMSEIVTMNTEEK